MFFLPPLAVLCLSLFLASCRDKVLPKPPGYFRIDFPGHGYRLFDSTCPFTFEYPVYGAIFKPADGADKPCCLDIDFKGYKGRIYMSYHPIHEDLQVFSEDSRSLAYKHTVRAESIEERAIAHPDKKVYGLIYEISGNTATSINFILTDSTRHFVRGSLYFNCPVNRDSLAPVIGFFRKDIDHLIETFRWK